jgi:acyl carrier protein phosphodiesterase
MNYLAHAYLSFGNPEVLTGNLISDFVKGKKKFDYSPGIQAGIKLHREIDEFTDIHPVTKISARVFRSDYGLYSAAFMDIVYDHFLALEIAAQGQEDFKEFTNEVYEKVDHFQPVLPVIFKSMFPYMKQQNWLFNYQYNWGIQKSFGGLVNRAAYMNESETAFLLFEKNYDELGRAYKEFFPQLMNFALNKFSDIH